MFFCPTFNLNCPHYNSENGVCGLARPFEDCDHYAFYNGHDEKSCYRCMHFGETTLDDASCCAVCENYSFFDER